MKRISQDRCQNSTDVFEARNGKPGCATHAWVAIVVGLVLMLGCSPYAAAQQQTIWPGSSVPASVDSGPSGPVELGVSFLADTSGTITGIRYYKSAANTGTHVGHLWSSRGALLATVTFVGETGSGWQQANFSAPVTIQGNTFYVASYGVAAGHWSANWYYFATAGVNSGHLHAPRNGSGSGNGLYGNFGGFPMHMHQSANYWVDVVFSSAATAVPPAITAQPASAAVTTGQSATFSVAASGAAPLRYQWNKNNAAIAGATSQSYTTPATTVADDGAMFNVVVGDSAGSVTSSAAKLTVNPNPATAPSITLQPVSRTVVTGQTATYSVAASGTAPLTYQWSRNNVAIAGATSSSYTTPAATTSDNGAMFAVGVGNSAGSVASAPAALIVNAATCVLSAAPAALNFGNVNVGASSALPVTLTNSGNSSVAISNTSISGAGIATAGVPAGTILAPGQTATLQVTLTPASSGNLIGGVAIASTATNSPDTISVSGNGAQSTFPAWVAPSLVRVGPGDPPATSTSISLNGARGETVDAQIVVQGPAGGLSNVNLSATALTGPSGATIPSSSFTLYREYYLTVTGTANYGGGSNPPLGSGIYPEPLIPFNDPETGAPLCGTSAQLKACNASVSAGQNQPYWIDISVPHGPANAPPGIYTGGVTVTSSQGTVNIPVTLTVWNFELPMQPSELSLWTLWPPAAGNTTTTLAQALMRNKVMGWYDSATNASADMANLGLNRSGLDASYYIGIQCSGAYSSLPSTSQIDAAAANFPAGLGLDFYLADELNGCTSDYTPTKTLAANAHAANRSVKTMMTVNAPDANLYGAIDHWVLLDSMQQWPPLPFTGGDLWSYTSCNAGFGNAPEWMVDYPPINERIQAGFLNWAEGATGILYYRADGWTAGNAIGSWNNVDTTACGGGLGRPGDGIFLYPPGPIASTESAPGIRLKAIRDGIQDYEYAQILKNLSQVPFVGTVLQPIAGNWTNWTHDPNALEGARLQLGQLLNQLSPP